MKTASTRPRAADKKPRQPRREIFDLVVACKDERQQRALFERLVREGFMCRVITA